MHDTLHDALLYEDHWGRNDIDEGHDTGHICGRVQMLSFNDS